MKWRHAQQQQAVEADDTARNADDNITSSERAEKSPDACKSDMENLSQKETMEVDVESSDEELAALDIEREKVEHHCERK